MSGVILEFFVLGMVAMIILMAFLQCCISCARMRGKKPLNVNIEEGIIQEPAVKEKKIKAKSKLKNDFLTQLRKTTGDE